MQPELIGAVRLPERRSYNPAVATREADAVIPAAVSAVRSPSLGHSLVWNGLCFYVGFPLAICIYLTLNNWKLLESLGFLSTFAFYLGHAAVPWAMTLLVTAVLHRALARWRPGLLALTTAGSLAACIPTVFYTSWLMSAWPGIIGGQGMESAAGLVWGWSDIFEYAVRATVLWVGLNFLFDRYFGLPRYRYASRDDECGMPATADEVLSAGIEPRPSLAADAVPDGQVPAFMQRLKKPASLDSVLALRAEQHYLRVITTAGRELVLYRLSDALRELPPQLGVQVHRSWWVKRSAICGVECRGRKMTVVLSNQERVPVSTPYQGLVRSLAMPGDTTSA